jgi:hypothetical protein
MSVTLVLIAISALVVGADPSSRTSNSSSVATALAQPTATEAPTPKETPAPKETPEPVPTPEPKPDDPCKWCVCNRNPSQSCLKCCSQDKAPAVTSDNECPQQ